MFALQRLREAFCALGDFSSSLLEKGRNMRRTILATLAIALLLSLTAYGQSLGDVARANREKQQKATTEDPSTTPPKVITNADLPKDQNPASDSDDDAAPPADTAANKSADRRSAQQTIAQQHAAEQWKRQILAQKHKVSNLQARVDQLNASIQAANGSAQFEGPNSRYQAQQMQRAADIQLQLNEQKKLSPNYRNRRAAPACTPRCTIRRAASCRRIAVVISCQSSVQPGQLSQ